MIYLQTSPTVYIYCLHDPKWFPISLQPQRQIKKNIYIQTNPIEAFPSVYFQKEKRLAPSAWIPLRNNACCMLDSDYEQIRCAIALRSSIVSAYSPHQKTTSGVSEGYPSRRRKPLLFLLLSKVHRGKSFYNHIILTKNSTNKFKRLFTLRKQVN